MSVTNQLRWGLVLILGWPATGPAQELPTVPAEARLVPRWQDADGHRSQEWLVGFSADSKLAFFEQATKKVIARDTTTWKRTGQVLVNESDRKPPASGHKVRSPDGTLTADIDPEPARADRGRTPRDIVLRSTKSGDEVARAAAHAGPAQLLFTPDSRTLISAAADGITLWDLPGLTRRKTLGPVNSTPADLFLHPAGDLLGVRCRGVSYEDQFWDLKAGVMRAALGGHGIDNYPVQVWGLAFAPDGRALASIGNDPQVRVWDVRTGFGRLTVPLHFNSRNGEQKVAWSPDGKTLAAGERSAIRLYDAATGKPGPVLEGHTSQINALAFSPDGKRLVSASGRGAIRLIGPTRRAEPGEVIVWDLEAGKPLHVLRAYKQGAYAVAWSPDGGRLATGGVVTASDDEGKGAKPRDGISIWDARSGELVRAVDPTEAGASLLAFNPDGQTLAHGSRGQTRIVEAATGKEVRVLPTGGNAIAFRKDGKLLAAAGGSGGFNSAAAGFIELWDPHAGRRVAQQRGHEKEITAVVFHPDGTAVATGGYDGAIWMWDIVPAGK